MTNQAEVAKEQQPAAAPAAKVAEQQPAAAPAAKVAEQQPAAAPAAKAAEQRRAAAREATTEHGAQAPAAKAAEQRRAAAREATTEHGAQARPRRDCSCGMLARAVVPRDGGWRGSDYPNLEPPGEIADALDEDGAYVIAHAVGGGSVRECRAVRVGGAWRLRLRLDGTGTEHVVVEVRRLPPAARERRDVAG